MDISEPGVEELYEFVLHRLISLEWHEHEHHMEPGKFAYCL